MTTRTTSSRAIFTNLYCGRAVVNAIRWHDVAGHTLTWAFVVMPDHLHWLFELAGRASVSDVVGRMKSFSSRSVNAVINGSGRVWQPGFHDHAVRAEEDLRAIARYVVMNPIRAGLASSPGGYALWDARWLS